MANIPSPVLPTKELYPNTADYLAAMEVYECHLRYKRETDNLATFIPLVRQAGVSTFYDKDVAHANGVIASITQPIARQACVEDMLMRCAEYARTGVLGQSPVPQNMSISISGVDLTTKMFTLMQIVDEIKNGGSVVVTTAS